MKMKMLAAVFILACATTVGAAISMRSHVPTSGRIRGDYVEARTASVFCGPCHYNGEYVTTGHDAVMAWKIDGGSYEGVDLKGLRVMAAVTSPENLGDEASVKRTELAFDVGATKKQMAAFTDLLRTRLSDKLGSIVSVHQAPVSFVKRENGYDVTAAGFGAMNVDYRADNSCCVQPSLVWYEPFSPVEHRMVGYTNTASYSGTITDPWYRSAEDSAFYGAIAF